MTKFSAVVLLLMLYSPGYAEVRIDDFNLLAPPNTPFLDVIIEHGNLKDTNNFLFSPVCTGSLQSPALITDLNAFLEGYTGMRVIERVDGHYLLMQDTEFSRSENPQTTVIAADRLYIELEFSSVAEGAFILRATPTFFAATFMGSSNCLAGIILESEQVRS